MTKGIGSGLDIPSIVDGLMSVEQRGVKRLEQKKSLYQTQLSSYTQTRNSLKQFADTISKLDKVMQQHYYKVNSDNEAVATALVNGNNPTHGNFKIEVTQLAAAHQIASTTFSSDSQALNLSGQMTLTQGSNTFNIDINATDTLDNIRDNINAATGRQGLSASIFNTTDLSGNPQCMLLLSATNSGISGEINLTGDNPLQINTVIQAARDAEFTVNNYSVTRSTNTISDVLDGITFQLNQAAGNANINVSEDTSNQATLISTSLNDFVQTYNRLIDELAKNQSLSTLRDSTYPMIKQNLQALMTQTLGVNSIDSLLKMGIQLAPAEMKTNDDGVEYTVTGKLSINYDALHANIENNLPQLRSFFTSTGSDFDSKLLTTLTTLQTGPVYNREHILKQERDLLSKQITRENERIDTLKTNLTYKYAALDNIISKYQQIGDFLDQQIMVMTKQKR